MGAYVTRPSNKEMVDRLTNYLTSADVEAAFRAVDRGMYCEVEEGEETDPYEDGPWRGGILHLSAPSIYAQVVQALDLKPGHSFLNLGSGTGYLNTLVGLLVGPHGINHGIEYHEDVVEFAKKKLGQFKQNSYAIDKFDFAEPIFISGNCLNLDPNQKYDRIYLGAACLPEVEGFMKNLLKPHGGVLIMPFGHQLKRYTRDSETDWSVEGLMDVNFTQMIMDRGDKNIFTMPIAQPRSLKEFSRVAIRQLIRERANKMNPRLKNRDNLRARRLRRRRKQLKKLRLKENSRKGFWRKQPEVERSKSDSSKQPNSSLIKATMSTRKEVSSTRSDEILEPGPSSQILDLLKSSYQKSSTNRMKTRSFSKRAQLMNSNDNNDYLPSNSEKLTKRGNNINSKDSNIEIDNSDSSSSDLTDYDDGDTTEDNTTNNHNTSHDRDLNHNSNNNNNNSNSNSNNNNNTNGFNRSSNNSARTQPKRRFRCMLRPHAPLMERLLGSTPGIVSLPHNVVLPDQPSFSRCLLGASFIRSRGYFHRYGTSDIDSPYVTMDPRGLSTTPDSSQSSSGESCVEALDNNSSHSSSRVTRERIHRHIANIFSIENHDDNENDEEIVEDDDDDEDDDDEDDDDDDCDSEVDDLDEEEDESIEDEEDQQDNLSDEEIDDDDFIDSEFDSDDADQRLEGPPKKKNHHEQSEFGLSKRKKRRFRSLSDSSEDLKRMKMGEASFSSSSDTLAGQRADAHLPSSRKSRNLRSSQQVDALKEVSKSSGADTSRVSPRNKATTARSRKRNELTVCPHPTNCSQTGCRHNSNAVPGTISRRGAQPKGSKYTCQRCLDGKSRQPRVSECERYHQQMITLIRQLPIPPTLHNYLNYERKL